jgi:signal transduction histidine kinase
MRDEIAPDEMALNQIASLTGSGHSTLATLAQTTQDGQDGSAPGSSMSGLVAAFNWRSTPLGPFAVWPDSLKAAVRILLTSRFPMWMAWGPELTFLYNDAYARTTLGKKHPWALGRPAAEVWSEIWTDIAPRIKRVMTTGEASWDETLLLILERSGYPEETYHTFSYSPLADSGGRIAGMLCVVMEDTARVIGERQLAALSTLAGSLADAITERDVFTAISLGLTDQPDMPFALVYLFEEDTSRLKLVASTGISAEHAAAAGEIELDSPWPIGEVLASRRAVTIDSMGDQFPALPAGSWDKPPAQARLVPIARQGQEMLAGVFVAALNPYRQPDIGYAGFLDLVAGQIAAAITNAQAFELERKRAESLAELDRAKTAFFSNVSHELRTPLTLILGPIEDALAAETPPSRDSLELLHRNAQRLLKLVNGLLDFVRIEVGRLHASYEPTDLSLLTSQLGSVFRSAIERAGLQLTVECTPLPEPVYVDREMWEKIILNLLSNALKSTFDGGIRISVQHSGDEAHVTVADTGTGISEDDLPRLFQRFQRIEGARRRSHEGSGIGLALVRELVEMHGGTIRAESKLGGGTAFHITLRFGHEHLSHGRVLTDAVNLAAAQDSASAYVAEALEWLPRRKQAGGLNSASSGLPQALSKANGDLQKPIVLLVDDNADMREYVQDLLTQRFHVITAENGRRALEEAARTTPNLVLTDIMMPEMDGFALLSSLRQNPATRTIPVIMLSARAGEEARVEGIDAGADDYLIKPFSARELIAHVEAQLKMARLRREAAEQETALTREINNARQFAWDALEHIPDPFCTLDWQFRTTYMNAAATTLVAAGSANEPTGKSIWDLYPMFKETAVEVNLRQAMEQRVPVEFEQYFQTGGTESWFQFHIHPQAGEGLILYLRNATEARRTEQALRRSEQLAAAGRLAASVAHEINNPLEAVTNLLFLAKLDATVAQNTKDLLEVADKELQRLSHIAARSLKFYRQRTGPTLTGLEELIDSVLFFNEPAVKMRNIQLERRYRPAPPVLCLPGEIQQVMTNLIGNALDALSDRGRLIVAVRPGRDRAGRGGVAVTVADTGCGMNRRTLSQLFHPFITTKGEAGTGLGLWVSKGILDKHQSTIAVRTRPGRGTVFRLFFPLDAATATVAQAD